MIDPSIQPSLSPPNAYVGTESDTKLHGASASPLAGSTLSSLQGESVAPGVKRGDTAIGEPGHPKLEKGVPTEATEVVGLSNAIKALILEAQLLFQGLAAFAKSLNDEAPLDPGSSAATPDASSAAAPDASASSAAAAPGAAAAASPRERLVALREQVVAMQNGGSAPAGNGVGAWLVGTSQTAMTVAMMAVAQLQKEITQDYTKLALLQREVQVEMRDSKMAEQILKGETMKQQLLSQAYTALIFASIQLGFSVLSLAASIKASGQKVDEAGNKVFDSKGNPEYNTNYAGGIDAMGQAVAGYGGAADKLIQASYQTTLANIDAAITLYDDIYQSSSKLQDRLMQLATKAQDQLFQLLDQLSQWHDKITQIHISAQGN